MVTSGNLTSKLDARSITTTIAYDALNRPTSKSYNDSPQTPTVSYFYDSQSMPTGAPTFDRGSSTGRLVAATYGGSSSAGTYRGYDAMGRVIRQYQQTDSVNYLVEASYYANSSLQNETYPSVPGAGDRRVVSYTNDSAGRLASLNSNATTYAPAASVSSIGYASHNALNMETYGNSLVHAVSYNTRLQVNEIKLGTSVAPTSVVDLTYSYGTTGNNGNLQSITYAGGGLSYTQSFTYDALNRLATAQENSGSSWSQTSAYDRYGNRQIDYGGGSYNLSFSSSTNRITTSGFSYDSAGNLTNDGVHAYTFDAENKISKVDNVSAYVYDGEGQRVRKLVGENTRFVYGIGGHLVAEFDGSNGNLKKEYVYGSSLITIEPTVVNSNGTQYSTSDHLGSPRVVTNASAGVVSRHDYMPFGEELGATVGGRTTGMGFSVADGSRQKFTQQERDNETSLDYMHARYYSSAQGRFPGADSFPGSVANPQTWNLYSYVRNNPLIFTDPTGHYADHGMFGVLNDPWSEIPTTVAGIAGGAYDGSTPPTNTVDEDLRLLEEILAGEPQEKVGFGVVLSMDRTTIEHYCDTYLNGRIISSVMDSITSDVTTAIIGYSDQPTAEGLGSQQPKYGKYPGDDRGHIVGAALGGSPQPENLFSQDPRVNRGAYRDFERDILRVLTKHEDWVALIKVTLVYEQMPRQRTSCTTSPERYFRPIGEQYSVSYMERYTNAAKAVGTPASKWFSN